MHEVGLFRDLRTKMIEIAEVERVPRIGRVRVWVGALAHLSEARLREAWPDLVRGTPAEGSRLEVELSHDATDPRAQGSYSPRWTCPARAMTRPELGGTSMCLAVPGRIEKITVAPDGSRSAEVDFPTGRRSVSLLFLPEVREGDHILAQAGYAMRRLTPEQVAETLGAATTLPREAGEAVP